MNEIVNNFLFAGDKFMPEMHLKQLGFTYSSCCPFTKNKEKIQIFKETRDPSYIYKNERDKTCFQHDMAYGDFQYLAKRIASDKLLRDKAFNIAKNSKYDGYQRRFGSLVYKFFDKKSAGGDANAHANNERPLNLAEELHKQIIRKFKRRTVYSRFEGNIWGAD